MLEAAQAFTFGYGRKTAVADTKIDRLIDPGRGKKIKVTNLKVTVGGTAHTLTFLRPLNTTTLSAAAAAAQAVINLTADPGDYSGSSVADNPIAAGDYLVIEKPDGTYHLAVVSSVSTLAITLTANVPTGGFDSGATVWFLGVAADTDPHTAEPHPVFTLPASGATTMADFLIAQVLQNNAPMLAQINNATAASVLEYINGVYGP